MSDQTPATPVETEIVEPVDATQIPAVVETPVVPEEPAKVEEDEDNDEEFHATDLAYWKKFSRDNERAKNKALEANKVLQAKLDAAESEIHAAKFEGTVVSVISEYGLSDAVRPLLTATDVDGLKAQAAALVSLAGGKLPAPVVEPELTKVEAPRVINPLAGLSDVKTPKNSSFGARMLANIEATKHF